MKDQQQQPQCSIIEKLDALVKETKNFLVLVKAAESDLIISPLEKDTILKKFVTTEEQRAAFYLLLNSKAYPMAGIQNLFNSTGNSDLISILQEKHQLSEKEEWDLLQKIISSNIDRLSSHTMNLGMVLCFASGIGLITGKDREIIAKSSSLEIDQLKQFYSTVSHKQEDAFGKVIKVLKMTNNNWALDVLEIDDTSD